MHIHKQEVWTSLFQFGSRLFHLLVDMLDLLFDTIQTKLACTLIGKVSEEIHKNRR
jgi:hypothetical protein